MLAPFLKKDINGYILNLMLYASLLFVLDSCENFLEVEVPNSKIPSELVFTDDATATSALIGIYLDLYSNSSFAGGDAPSVVTSAGLSADELINNPRIDQVFLDFQENNINPANHNLLRLWTSMYKAIYGANAILEGLSASPGGVTTSTRNQLTGEALFIRALCNFYLINLFGDVPLVITTDYKTNARLSRTAVEEVYNQVKSDLLAAEELLAETYIGGERIRPNKASSTALLSRVYLYTGDWERAEDKATNVIVKSDLYGLQNNLNDVFLATSREAIWQLRPTDDAYFTNEGYIFGISEGPKYNVIADELLNAFEAGDNRRNAWITSLTSSGTTLYLPYKYRKHQISTPTNEYSVVLRLGEQYLIRAEARARQNKLPSAISDINKIRNRAGLPSIPDTDPGMTQENLMIVIEQERRVELLVEWGHRWFDLKRWNRTDAVLGHIKSGWTDDDLLYPIPQGEINKNSNLRPQNPGY